MGTKGMMVKKKMMAGNIARKKSNEMADARMVNRPSNRPLPKKVRTLKSGIPSKPGNTILRKSLMVKAVLFLSNRTVPALSFDKYL